MGLVRGLAALAKKHSPSAVSIGNFDGVHLGHQQVVNTLLSQAKTLGIDTTVVTFEPFAREFFKPNSIARLSSLEERAERLLELGVTQVLTLEFNEELANLSPQQFIKGVLIDGLNTQFLSVGDDFRFGHQREGDFQTLVAAGHKANFIVQRHKTFEIDGKRVSSGRIRTALLNDQLDEAHQLLGRAYSIGGTIAVGQKLGRTLSFPTANINLGDRYVPVRGVYAVRVEVPGEEGLINGVANVGYRPTVDGSEQRLEVHLFDFDRSIYGQHLNVLFKHKIRDEQKFASLDLLKAQIAADAREAKRLLEIK